jgi:hypothetical protein
MTVQASPFDDPVVGEVYLHLVSPAGQQRIAHALQRRRLPVSFDAELESAVLFEAIRFVHRGGEIANPVVWANQRITARSIDLARGAIRNERASSLFANSATDGFSNAFAANDNTDNPFAEHDLAEHDFADDDLSGIGLDRDSSDAVVEAEFLPDVRRRLMAADESGVNVSAALTIVTVLAERPPLAPECPQPLAGATESDAAGWAGLWYAGRIECFGEGNTVTQRRARASRRARALVLSALTEVTGRHE